MLESKHKTNTRSQRSFPRRDRGSSKKMDPRSALATPVWRANELRVRFTITHLHFPARPGIHSRNLNVSTFRMLRPESTTLDPRSSQTPFARRGKGSVSILPTTTTCHFPGSPGDPTRNWTPVQDGGRTIIETPSANPRRFPRPREARDRRPKNFVHSTLFLICSIASYILFVWIKPSMSIF